MLEEKISRHLNIPFVEIMYNNKKYYLCNNGVLFADSEYMEYADLNAEYERRAKEDKLYDYAYAKSTGLLRKKRGYAKKQEILSQDVEEIQEAQKATEEARSNNEGRDTERDGDNSIQRSILETELSRTSEAGREDTLSRRVSSRTDEIKENERQAQGKAVYFIVALLAFTSVISGYISTLQTATYLFDYVDVISAWLMSSSVTAYNVTAFEVAVLFKQNRRYGLTFVFITLWVTVTFFSMATAVSVFYDRFNFNETIIAEDNRNIDSNKLALELLRTKEKDIREAIAFKKQDIEYRQEHDYATTAVRNELVKLEAGLQENLSEQQKLLSDTPEVTQEVIKKKEKLFAFLGRMLDVDSGVFEFIMSTLSAIFVNLIAPLSVVAVAELKKKLDK